jgi:hypothetical protein
LDFRKDGVKAHRFVSSLNNDRDNKAMEPLIVGGRTVSSPKDIANALCTYYAGVSRLHVPREAVKRINKLPPALCLGEREHDLMNDDFKMEELKAALLTLKAGKSAGPDGIFPEFLLNMGHEAGKTFLKLANLTWKKGLLDQWQKSEIIPILKKGKSPTDAESYRPVSLTSICCKLTERMVVERLSNHLENEGRIKEEQAGFRKHRSTMEQVMKFTQAVKDGFHRKMSTAAVLVDFKAAYDRVWRQMLIHKIQGSVRGHMLRWIKSFLAQRHICVRLRHVSSRFKQQRQRLPQGAVLSCLLFNIMINDLIDAVQLVPGVSALLYADDLLIWATSGDPKRLEEPLREALQRVQLWADLSQMTVSAEKTVYQLFTLSTRRYHLDLFLNIIRLQRKTCQSTWEYF